MAIARVAVAVACAALVGCASGLTPGIADADREARSVTGDAEEVRQTLFRVRYRGKDGRGSVRLTLRSMSEDRFQLGAADSFGRRLWSFETEGDSSLLLDHRARRVCQLEGEVFVRAVALADLSIDMLPRVLHLELPVTPAEAPVMNGELAFVDERRRRWTARMESGAPATWTLWSGEEPLVWFLRRGSGGILSHREGAQVLWTMGADETVAGSLPPLEVPDSYEPGECDADDLS